MESGEFGSINTFIATLALSSFIFLTLVYSFSGSSEEDSDSFVDDKILIVTAIDLFDCVEMLEFNMLPEYELPGDLRYAITAFAILLFWSSVIALYGLGEKENDCTEFIVSLIGLISNLFFMGVRGYVANKSHRGISIFVAKNVFFALIDIKDIANACC